MMRLYVSGWPASCVKKLVCNMFVRLLKLQPNSLHTMLVYYAQRRVMI